MDKHNFKSINSTIPMKEACFVQSRKKKKHVAVLVHSMLPNGYTASDREKLKEFEKRIMGK